MFRVPREFHLDKGSNFESTIFTEMCSLLGIHKTRLALYNPRSDSIIERFNRTLQTMLSKLIDPEKNQKDWDEKIQYAMMAYRSSVHESSGETQSMLMLEREITLPIDIIFERVLMNQHLQQILHYN